MKMLHFKCMIDEIYLIHPENRFYDFFMFNFLTVEVSKESLSPYFKLTWNEEESLTLILVNFMELLLLFDFKWRTFST